MWETVHYYCAKEKANYNWEFLLICREDVQVPTLSGDAYVVKIKSNG